MKDDVKLQGPTLEVLQLLTTGLEIFFVLSTAVCSATFHRDLSLLLLSPYRIITAFKALQAAAQLRVCCALLDGHLCINRPVRFLATSAAAGIIC